MKIILNGAEHDVTGPSLTHILDELGFGDAIVATALNGDFVPKPMRTTTVLDEGDAVEIVAPMQGG